MRRMGKRRDCQQSRAQRLVLGVFILAVGVISLLDNLGVLNSHQIFSFWPMVFIVLGTLKLAQARSASGFLVGTVLFGIGVLLTLENLGYLDIDWRVWWPALLIAAGVSSILKGFGRRTTLQPEPETASAPASELPPSQEPTAAWNADAADSAPQARNPQPEYRQETDMIEAFALISGSKSRNSSQNFRGGEITALMGGAEVDLRRASFQGEATLQVVSIMGGIEIFVPGDWSVIIHGMPLLGAIEDNTLPPPHNNKRLIVTGVALMGGVEFKN